MYDFALLTKQQLEDVGFNIDLQVVDWATLVKRRNNPKEYEVFTTGMGAFYDPTHSHLSHCELAGLDVRRGDPEDADASWPARPTPRSASRSGSRDAAVLREGPGHPLRRPVRAARRAARRVKGFNEKTERVRFYNVWLEK